MSYNQQEEAEGFAGRLAGRLKEGARERDSIAKRTAGTKTPAAGDLQRRLTADGRGGKLSSPAPTESLEGTLRKKPGRSESEKIHGKQPRGKASKRSRLADDDSDGED